MRLHEHIAYYTYLLLGVLGTASVRGESSTMTGDSGSTLGGGRRLLTDLRSLGAAAGRGAVYVWVGRNVY